MKKASILIYAIVGLLSLGSADAKKNNKKNLKDLSELVDVFTTDSLPDDKYMTSIGNGHVATTVFSDAVYMNGLYNGKTGDSSRARIPAWSNIQISNDTINGLGESAKVFYSLDTTVGAFIVNLQSESVEVEQRIFAHRYYTRAIINQFVVTPKGSGISAIKIDQLPGLESNDIKFDETSTVIILNETEIYTTCGKTLVVEDENYQKETSPVCIFWTEAPKILEVPSDDSTTYTFVMTIDSEREVALEEMRRVLLLNASSIYKTHKSEWGSMLESGKIEIEGNVALAKTVNAAWYYLLSSMPSINSSQPLGKFYGLSPVGLARGGSSSDYLGHSFWDTEIWMFPPILLLQPEMAKSLLQYRIDNLKAAEDLAKLTGHKGARFPWESAYTGNEVTSECCRAYSVEEAMYQHHITGCVAFAARQYVSLASDEEWLKNGGCSLISEIAEFWASRAIYNNETGFYDIKEVMGPDEDHLNVTNSVFTNVVAGLALYLGDYASCLCNSTVIPKTNWSSIAAKLALTYDGNLNYHPQFEGYERPMPIKQADVVLLGFPLLYKMHPSTRENDLLYYENVTREDGPAMTWSMHTVGHLQLENSKQAALLFNRSYQPYVREPFKVWTEEREPEIGVVNFITGIGGFLQSILFGYAGINIHLDKLEIANFQLIPNTTALKIHGIKYHGSSMTLNIYENYTEIEVEVTNPKRELILHTTNYKIPLISGGKVYLNGKGPFQIKREVPNNCTLPLDLIGQQS